MNFEKQYEDILQNIEFAIMRVYRGNPNMSDYEVMNALEALIDQYEKEKSGRPPRKFRLSEREQTLVETMHEMCEVRLGRGEQVGGPDLPPEIEPNTVDEIIACLKRIEKSAKMWNKERGRQGYLTFVDQFV